MIKKTIEWFFIAIFIATVIWLFSGCTCDPNKPKAAIRPFVNQPEIVLKGYDEDCSGDLDYWQHYKNGEPFARRIYIDK